MRLFAGDDWAGDHHGIEVMDEAGQVLAKRRLPEGAAGMTQMHALTGRFLPEDADDTEGEYFPAALEAFEDLDAPDVLELLAKAPDPARAAKLTRAQVAAALKRPPPGHRGQGRCDPGRAARRAPRAAGRADRRLRRYRPLPDRGNHHPERPGQDPGRAGEGTFWPAPGR
jgi:hypothetical protein